MDCQVCLMPYNITSRKPKTLPCGHTYCTECLTKLQKESTIECPKDRQNCSIASGKIDELITNFAILEFLPADCDDCHENPQDGPCLPEHCSKRLCSDCKTSHLKLFSAELVAELQVKKKHVSEQQAMCDDASELTKMVDQSKAAIAEVKKTKQGIVSSPVTGTPITQANVDAGTAGVHSDGIKVAHVDQPAQFYVDTQGHNGNLMVLVEDPNSISRVNVEPDPAGKFLVTYVPVEVGIYNVMVKWNGKPVEGSPFHPRVVDARKVRPIGGWEAILDSQERMHLKISQRNRVEFDTTMAGPGEMRAEVKGPDGPVPADVEGGNGKYAISFIPRVQGAYLLSIMWSDRQICGSPYKGNVLPSSDASKVSVSGEGIRGGVFGKEIKAIIDTRRAAPGELAAHCMGPQKVAYCKLYNHRDGTFILNIKPQEAGKHLLQVKYGGEHVPGSPFILRVAGAPDASKVSVKGPGIEHGILADYQSRFICETRGAGAGQLTVRIRGPKGAFRVEMSRENSKDRTILCLYDPTEDGDYIISVTWSEEHVPGSPFHVQIFNTRNELERFLQNNPDRRKNAPALADEPWSDHF